MPHRLSVPSDPSVEGALVPMDRSHENNSVSRVFEDLYFRSVLFWGLFVNFCFEAKSYYIT